MSIHCIYSTTLLEFPIFFIKLLTFIGHLKVHSIYFYVYKGILKDEDVFRAQISKCTEIITEVLKQVTGIYSSL